MPNQKSNPLSFSPGISPNAEPTPTVQTLWRTVPNEKGAAALRSPVPFWTTDPDRSRPAETNASPHLRMFSDEKGAKALMRVITPEGVAEGSDHRRELLESVEIPPQALPELAKERAGTLRAYLIQTGRVQPERITESARGASSKGSRVYLWLQ